MEQAYVRERVTPLLKQDTRYIYDVPHQVSCKETVMLMVSANINHKKIIDKNDVPFSHPAIEDAIISLFFPPKPRTKALASFDLEAFNPMPLETIAFTCTLVSNSAPHSNID